MGAVNPTIAAVTARIAERSRRSRADYLARMAEVRNAGRARSHLSCGNLAHGFAAAPAEDKTHLRDAASINLAIVTAYNDMLSAHQPYGEYPPLIKIAARAEGCTAQVAGGVSAMCDGITQGRPGMELSLFSRDVIALSTAVALSHNMFEAVLCLGICDKIVPGLIIGALSFGHLPTVMVPGGPMSSGFSNREKARVRAAYAEGRATRDELLAAEAKSYHEAGTCTFYGTANSNQMLMEVMGLHVPGAAFIHPGTPLRQALTRAAVSRAIALARSNDAGLAKQLDERSFVNGIVGLMATGGSTNHALHLPAMARAAGILINWDDFAEISRVTPLLARIYPNGAADVNHFHAAGGMGFLISQLLRAGLLHEDIATVAAGDLQVYAREPYLNDGTLDWRDPPPVSLDREVLRGIDEPFSAEGGLKLLKGNLGRAVIKISAVAPEHRSVRAPVRIFHDQDAMIAAFKRGELDRDVIVVLRFQGPRANGMPELHALTPTLSVLLDRGYKVALVTDGRMSGASGKVAAAIHVTPEAMSDGPLARLRDGDILHLDSEAGVLEAELDLAARDPLRYQPPQYGLGRELFAHFRQAATPAEAGASVLYQDVGL